MMTKEQALKRIERQEKNLQEAHLRWANLQGANLQEANLQEANLWKANLQGANLQGADLRWADLRYANLRDADLRGANLWKANLQGANLQGADLRWADLREADLRGADVRGANLQGATLWGADVQGAKGFEPWNMELASLRKSEEGEFFVTYRNGVEVPAVFQRHYQDKWNYTLSVNHRSIQFNYEFYGVGIKCLKKNLVLAASTHDGNRFFVEIIQGDFDAKQEVARLERGEDSVFDFIWLSDFPGRVRPNLRNMNN